MMHQGESKKRIRHSCANCVKYKVKCSSHKPSCTRCTRRNLTCAHLTESKRGRKRKQLLPEIIIKELKPLFLKLDPVGDILLFCGQKLNFDLTWSLFESFLQNVSTKTSKLGQSLPEYFAQMVLIFRQHSRIAGSTQVSVIDSMFKDTKVSTNKLTKSWNKPEETPEYLVKKMKVLEWFNDSTRIYRPEGDLLVGGRFTNKSAFNSMLQNDDLRLPSIVLHHEVSDLVQGSTRNLKVSSNAAFETVFGLSDDEIEKMLTDNAVGFLPYGASLLALIGDSAEVITYLKSHALKVRQYEHGFKNSLNLAEDYDERSFSSLLSLASLPQPFILEIPDIISIRLNVKKSPYDSTKTPCLFFLTVVSKSVGDGSYFYDAISLQFQAMQDISHLFVDEVGGEDIFDKGTLSDPGSSTKDAGQKEDILDLFADLFLTAK